MRRPSEKSDWIQLEKELENIFSDKLRRIWLQYTITNTAIITVFPLALTSQYQIIIVKKVTNWSIENLKRIILLKLK